MESGGRGEEFISPGNLISNAVSVMFLVLSNLIIGSLMMLIAL